MQIGYLNKQNAQWLHDNLDKIFRFMLALHCKLEQNDRENPEPDYDLYEMLRIHDEIEVFLDKYINKFAKDKPEVKDKSSDEILHLTFGSEYLAEWHNKKFKSVDDKPELDRLYPTRYEDFIKKADWDEIFKDEPLIENLNLRWYKKIISLGNSRDGYIYRYLTSTEQESKNFHYKEVCEEQKKIMNPIREIIDHVLESWILSMYMEDEESYKDLTDIDNRIYILPETIEKKLNENYPEIVAEFACDRYLRKYNIIGIERTNGYRKINNN